MDVAVHYAEFLKIAICGLLIGTAIYFRVKPMAGKKRAELFGYSIRLSTAYGLALITAMGIAFEAVGRTFNLFTGQTLMLEPAVIGCYAVAVFILSSRP